MAEKRVSVRLAAVGSKQVRAELEGVGDAGVKGFGRMSKEAELTNTRLAAFATRVKIAATVAVAATAAAGIAMIKSGIETIDAQANLAQSLGTTTRSIQVLAFAGDLAGVSMDEIAAASKKLTLKLSDAAGGTGTAVEALKRQPVSGTVLAGILTLQGPELLISGSNLQSVTWSNTGTLGANSAVAYGSFTAAYDLGTTGAGLRQHASVPVQQGKKYRAQVWFMAGGSPDARLNLRLQPGNLDSGIKGAFAAPTIFNQNGGAVSNLAITDLGGGFWLWSFDIVVGAGLTGCLLGAGNSTAGQIVTILGASLRERAWTGPAPG